MMSALGYWIESITGRFLFAFSFIKGMQQLAYIFQRYLKVMENDTYHAVYYFWSTKTVFLRHKIQSIWFACKTG